MRIYSMSLLFVLQLWNIKFYQCLELVHIPLPVIEITHYQGDYATSYYTYIVTTPVVRQYVPFMSFSISSGTVSASGHGVILYTSLIRCCRVTSVQHHLKFK